MTFVPADLILLLHTLYVAIVILGVPLIIVGDWRSWRWVRAPWFRLTHVLMIGIVVVESMLRINCPLTVWEVALRRQGTAGEDGFIARALRPLLYHDLPHWVFLAVYSLFGLVVAGLFIAVPMRWQGRKRAN